MLCLERGANFSGIAGDAWLPPPPFVCPSSVFRRHRWAKGSVRIESQGGIRRDLRTPPRQPWESSPHGLHAPLGRRAAAQSKHVHHSGRRPRQEEAVRAWRRRLKIISGLPCGCSPCEHRDPEVGWRKRPVISGGDPLQARKSSSSAQFCLLPQLSIESTSHGDLSHPWPECIWCAQRTRWPPRGTLGPPHPVHGRRCVQIPPRLICKHDRCAKSKLAIADANDIVRVK